jgi:hypothetical protein
MKEDQFDILIEKFDDIIDRSDTIVFNTAELSSMSSTLDDISINTLGLNQNLPTEEQINDLVIKLDEIRKALIH